MAKRKIVLASIIVNKRRANSIRVAKEIAKYYHSRAKTTTVETTGQSYRVVQVKRRFPAYRSKKISDGITFLYGLNYKPRKSVKKSNPKTKHTKTKVKKRMPEKSISISLAGKN
jgi:hypothetical protein